MEHKLTTEAMSRWYSMWGNQLDIKRVVSQMESVDVFPSQSTDETEKKEEELGKDDCEDEASLPHHPLHLLRQNAYCRND